MYSRKRRASMDLESASSASKISITDSYYEASSQDQKSSDESSIDGDSTIDGSSVVSFERFISSFSC